MTAPLTAFRNASIKTKLVIIVLAVATVILSVTASLSLAQTMVSGRMRMMRSMAVNANLLGEYCVVPLSFDDRLEADRMLSRIQSIPRIQKAVLYDTNGRVFASYNPRELPLDPLGPVAGDHFVSGKNSLTYFHRVVYERQFLGTLILHADTRELTSEAYHYAAVMAGIFALLILLSYLLALWMQRLISRPILDLAQATRRVSEKGDLSHRVHWSGKDEIGILYQGYNEMLDQLQARLQERDKAEEEARVRQQQLLQAGKLVTLGTLVSGVAHEINNPNAYIMLNTSLALKQWRDLQEKRSQDPDSESKPLDAEMCKRLSNVMENIYTGSQRIDSIVKRLKDYYRKDQARAKVPLQLNAVVDKAVEILDAKIRKHTRNFRFLRGDPLPDALGNFQELEQVLINLIENACQALPDADGAVTVKTSLEPDGSLLVEVRDNGAGIPQENLERITDPFFTTKREAGGTGLGLSLALSIVNDHGGRMKFSSSPGGGTIASVMLPALAAPAPQA